jgi:hypothetical protein
LSLGWAVIASNSLAVAIRGWYGYFPREYVIILIAAAVLVPCGFLMLSAGAFLKNGRRGIASVLGSMWIVQGFAYSVYAHGVAYYRDAWISISEWLFAAILIYGMVGAGFTMLLSHDLKKLHPAGVRR